MTKREEYEQKTEKLLMPIMEANGFELVDVEYVKEAGNWYLRAYIDKPGITKAEYTWSFQHFIDKHIVIRYQNRLHGVMKE